MVRTRFWRRVCGWASVLGVFVAMAGIFLEGAAVEADRTLPGGVSVLWCLLPLAVIGAGLLSSYFTMSLIPLDGGDDEQPATGSSKSSAGAPAPAKHASRTERLFQARDFLPDEMPEGWTEPLAIGGSHRWMFDTKTESCALTIARKNGLTSVRVYVVGRGTREPVTDARCSEILAHIRYVGEFIEGDQDADFPQARVWVGVPADERPRWRVPKSVPPPRERVLSPHLVAARKYLPQKLPRGWSVPVAIGDDHGTEWKDGAWMIGTSDDRFLIVCLVTSKGRVKLSVTFFGADGIEVSEGAAVEMLRHFRGVLEFAQTEATHDEGEVPTRTYLGEIAPEGGTRVLLN
jgi:hypothetical protein